MVVEAVRRALVSNAPNLELRNREFHRTSWRNYIFNS